MITQHLGFFIGIAIGYAIGAGAQMNLCWKRHHYKPAPSPKEEA